VTLAKLVSEYYLCSVPRALGTMLPSSIRRGRRSSTVAVAVPAVSREEALEAALNLEARAPRQAAVLRRLAESGEALPAPALLEAAGGGYGALKALEKKGLIRLEAREKDDPSPSEPVPTRPLPLTEEQTAAFSEIEAALAADRFRVFLLHGITGSGKTEIYLQAIGRVLARGRRAMILVPEISLTPQTGERFRARFGEGVAIMHSGLSDGERRRQWLRACRGDARIVLGPRSAVFAPLPDLGLIVVDEEHETSYKQSDASPYYHARDVAVLRAKVAGIPVVLGSATPSLESYYRAREGTYRLLRLRTRPLESTLPRVRIVDMRREREGRRGGGPFSDGLLQAMAACLSEAGQCIIFINRRGYDTAVVCRACGHVIRCRHCSVALIHHRQRRRLICHLCGFSIVPPAVCPQCGAADLAMKGLGTERVEDQLGRYFKGIPVERMDTDTVGARGSHREYLERFRRGKTRILVGTQMIAKGLDYPGVTLVGVVFADTGLNLADFRASEYTFQLLTQVAGRSGRRERPGEVVIQTYAPYHPALLAAARQDYEGFYEKEIRFRGELGFPPFTRLVSLMVLSRNPNRALVLAERVAELLRPRLPGEVEMLGPSPPPIERVRGRYRIQLLLKTREILPVNRVVAEVLKDIEAPRDVRIEVDVDPVSML